jgi:hypothetical protein
MGLPGRFLKGLKGVRQIGTKGNRTKMIDKWLLLPEKFDE